MTKKDIKEAYDLLGEYYYNARKDKKYTSYFYNENLEMPTTLKILGDVRGKKILDLGCGPGIYSKLLFDKGAIVNGLDNSEKMIELAKKEAEKVDFQLGDAEKLPYKNGKFDIVLSALMMGHLENWDKVLFEVNRVLKKKGFFIFSHHNPVTEKTQKKKWFFKKFRELEGYFEEGEKVKVWSEKNKNMEMTHYHKTYGTIIRSLISSGFEIVDYEDCKPLEESKEIYPKEYKITLNYPAFCVWKVMKK